MNSKTAETVTSRTAVGIGSSDWLAAACELLKRWQYANEKTSGYDGGYEGTPENDPNGKLGEDTAAFLARQAANNQGQTIPGQASHE